MKTTKLVIIPICLMQVASVYAASNWKLSPGILLQESYNSNLTLLTSGTKIDDYITEVTPYIGIRRKTRMLDLSADYRMQNLFYASESQYNDTYHQLKGKVTANLVRDVFFIDAFANYRQQNISNLGKVSYGNTSVTGNRTNVATARVKPYVKYRLGRTANLIVSAEKGIVRYSGGLNDSDHTRYRATLGSGKSFRRMQWKMNLSKENVDSVNLTDTVIQDYNVEAGYKLTRRFMLTATAGYDDNEYTRAGSTSNPRGSKWSVGFNWTPSKRTSVTARAGDRYYGNTAYLKVSNRARRTRMSATYDERVTVLSSTLFNGGNTTSTETTPPPLDSSVDPSLPSVNNAAYIRKRLSGDFSIKSAKSVLKTTFYSERRLYQTTDSTEKVFGGTVGFDWNFAQRSKLRLSATGQIQDFATSSRKDGLLYLRASVERKLRRKLTGTLSLVHQRRDSNINTNDYKQYVATFGINWKL